VLSPGLVVDHHDKDDSVRGARPFVYRTKSSSTQGWHAFRVYI
jgi:hypothetical protein